METQDNGASRNSIWAKILRTIHDLEVYIQEDLQDPRYKDVPIDPLLDIVSFAQGRIKDGGFEDRVVGEAMVHIDEYFLCWVGFKS